MSEYIYGEESRYPPPRQECIEAGFDYPHEGPDHIVLAGEYSCPSCQPRIAQKRMLAANIAIADEMRRANDLEERKITAKEQGYWQEPEVRVVRPYVPSARVEQPKQLSKGGMNIEPARES
jgi:hypothetical protein